MTEPVRLVIWDLDETFWKGTLSEGGIVYQQAIHNCVVELAKRGIVSSICSKNDFEKTKAVLIEHGIWDYFIFPSINWEPKGQRIRSIIDLVQLRAPTVMFIDDNPMNINEAKHYVPDLQVSDETIIPEILSSPLFKGKDDSKLSRLTQYKLLERRKTDELASGGNNLEFLRASDIRIEILHDVEANLDRAVELINRTNQLNFTKRRLPEDPAGARAELSQQIGKYNVQAGLVRVSDKYGDYGLCGYYAVNTSEFGARLLDFCFSCRTLNMGVENWVFEHLGRPRLQVVGEVLTDLFAPAPPIDWINQPRAAQEGASEDAGERPLGRVVLHGGCDLMPLELYFRPHANEVIGEFNALRDGVPIRPDHAANLRLAMSSPSQEVLDEAATLGYRKPDFETALAAGNASPDVVVLSFAIDAVLAVYRHKALDFRVPFLLPIRYPEGPGMDVTTLPREALGEQLQSHWAADAVDRLRQSYDYEGVAPEARFKEDVTAILAGIPATARVFLIGLNEERRAGSASRSHITGHARINAWIRDIVSDRPNVELVPIRDFVLDEMEVDANHPGHFSRMVYFRLAQHILKRVVETRRDTVPALDAAAPAYEATAA